MKSQTQAVRVTKCQKSHFFNAMRRMTLPKTGAAYIHIESKSFPSGCSKRSTNVVYKEK